MEIGVVLSTSVEGEPCVGKCEQPPNRGVRRTYWCGFRTQHTPKDHDEHDHFYRGEWLHCYG